MVQYMSPQGGARGAGSTILYTIVQCSMVQYMRSQGGARGAGGAGGGELFYTTLPALYKATLYCGTLGSRAIIEKTKLRYTVPRWAIGL